MRESIQTIKEPEDFHKPSTRISVINSFASELDQMQDDERIVEVEFVRVSDEDHKKEKEILEDIPNRKLRVQVHHVIVKTAMRSDMLFCYCDIRMCPVLNDASISDLFRNREVLFGRKYNYLTGINVDIQHCLLYTSPSPRDPE